MSLIIKVSDIQMEYKVKDSEYSNKGFVTKLTKDFFKPKYKSIKALNNINFEVYQGDILGYIGQNGAGKSTTIKLLLGLLYPASGEVKVFGKNPFKNRINLAKFTGTLMGQKSHLWWELPLIDSFKFIQKIYQCTSEEDDKWLEMLTEELNVSEFVMQPVRQLSLGQRMRGELICTLIHRPKLVYLDEPTVGLDVFSKQKIMELILKINREYNTTIILTTHEVSDIEKVCNRMILLDKGDIDYDGGVFEFIELYTNFSKVIIESGIPTKEIDSRLIVFSTNKSSIEYIFDKRKITQSEVIKLISELENVSNFSFERLSLSTVLKIREKEKKLL